MFRKFTQSAAIACTLLLALNNAIAQTMIPLPNHASTYSGNIRGFWFTAPTDFVITGLRVPSQAGSGLQYIQVFKINDGTPVVYSTTSTNFTSLHVTYGATNGVIQSVNIPISAGDKIGIVGQAGNVNSYGTVSGQYNIAGIPTTLARIGYQGSMSSTGIANYWTEPSSSSISRVEVYYTTCSTAVTQQPSSATICENEQALFGITAVDVTSYQWQVDEGSGFNSLSNGPNYSGVTTNTLTVDNTPATFDNYQFRCLVSKGSAACADTSDTVTLNVHGLVKADPLPANDSTCINATKDIQIKATGSITGYRWQIYNSISQAYEDLPVQPPYIHMGDILRIVGVSDTLDGAKYRVIMTGICDTVTSNELQLFVSAIPKVSTHPEDVTADQGDKVTFEVTATTSGARYQWQASSPGTSIFSNINDGGIYQGVKTNKLTVFGVNHAQTGFQFRCVIRVGNTCNAPGDTSNFAVLYVNPAVSVSGVVNEENLSIYPNPAGETLFIYAARNNDAQSFRIVDKTGKILLTGDLAATGNTKVDVGRLPADIYLIQVIDVSGHTLTTSRFTKL